VPVAEISVQGRNTQGVRLMRVGEEEKIVGVERVAGDENGNGGE
jgi:DNA gyrase subunit A